jgi:pimeloyl-ACP methyl ester carboxylesterase
MTPGHAAADTYPLFLSEESKARYMAAYDAVLAEWPVPYESLTLPTRLGTTHVIASGPADAPPLILLHSFAGSATVWRANVAGLSRHFRTYAVDIVGQPGKSVASRKLRRRQDYADWLADLLDGLKIGRASIVGCSFGGFLALSQASLTPDRVERVVLISPAGAFVGLSMGFVVKMLTASLRRRLRQLLGDTRSAGLHDLGMAAPKDALWGALMSVTMTERPRPNLINAPVLGDAELGAVRAPTLLLIGDGERLYDPAATVALAKRRMPGLQGAVVAGADHVAAMAQPDDVNTRILAFLRPAAA